MTDIISETDKLQCVERELRYRHRVYTRLISSGKMTAAVAAREIDLMQAIRDDYVQRAAAEQLL